MRRGLREITSPLEKECIPGVLAEWGYVRPVTPAEVQAGVWFAYGEDGLFWLMRDAAWEAADEAQLHVCAAPRARGRIADRFVLTAFEVIAQLLGLRVLHAPAREDWEPLLLRLGWTPVPGRTAPRWLARELPAWPGVWTPGAIAMEKRLAEEPPAEEDARAEGAA